jgi:hypothetical protein
MMDFVELMTWLLVTWLCDANGCEALPQIGPMTKSLCDELVRPFSEVWVGEGRRVVASCADTSRA